MIIKLCITLLLHFIWKNFSLKSTEFQRWRTSYPYPQSHMRNVARKASQTNYVFLTDIDIVPSKSKFSFNSLHLILSKTPMFQNCILYSLFFSILINVQFCYWWICLISYPSTVGNYVNVFFWSVSPSCHFSSMFLTTVFLFLVQIIQVGYFPHFHNYIYCIVLKMFDIFVCLWHKTLTNIALFLMTRSWLEQRQEKYFSWWHQSISMNLISQNFLSKLLSLTFQTVLKDCRNSWRPISAESAPSSFPSTKLTGRANFRKRRKIWKNWSGWRKRGPFTRQFFCKASLPQMPVCEFKLESILNK